MLGEFPLFIVCFESDPELTFLMHLDDMSRFSDGVYSRTKYGVKITVKVENGYIVWRQTYDKRGRLLLHDFYKSSDSHGTFVKMRKTYDENGVAEIYRSEKVD